LIQAKNFKNSEKKLAYIILMPSGLAHKQNITLEFLKKADGV